MRNLNETRLKAAELADRFDGLPRNMTHWTLCDVLNEAREPLGLDSDELWLLIFYIKRTQPDDWQQGQEPIVGWPKFEISSYTGWSEDKVSRVENRLCAKGLIAFRDSANCKRRAFRGPDGKLTQGARGISLAPSGLRAAEIMALAHEKWEHTRALHRIFSDLFDLRAKCLQLRNHADLQRDISQKLETIITDLPRRRDAAADLDAMKSLAKRAKQTIAWIRRILGLANEECVDVRGSSTINSQDNSHVLMRHMRRSDKVQQQPESNLQLNPQKISEILTSSPELLRTRIDEIHRECGANKTWVAILRQALVQYASDLGVTGRFFYQLEGKHGLEKALTAITGLGRMVEKGADIRSPQGYAITLALGKRRDRASLSTTEGSGFAKRFPAFRQHGSGMRGIGQYLPG